MAAVCTPGETVLGNAACEPHVQDLCRFLVSLGGRIEGIESNVLRINGVERLAGGTWTIGPDHIGVGSFIGMAAITGGEVTIEAAAKIVGVCNMTALRMLRRGDIKGRQVCPGAPWVIKIADLTGFTGRRRSDPPLTPNTDQRAFDFQ